VPAGSAEVVIEATPFATLTVPRPENVTVPVAVAGATVAVNVTAWPWTEGFTVLETPVVVDPFWTVTDRAGEELEL
jgi:hypothetical protein